MSTSDAAPTRRLEWNGWTWGAIGLVVAFIAITIWWLAEDRGVPFGDAASYLLTIGINHHIVADGDLGRLFHSTGIYPPLTVLVGTAATFVGGIGVAPPVLAQNLVYVPMLALACYQLGRRLAGAQAGFLAVAFALGSPLLIEQFHVFMLDAPEAAVVAVAVWLIVASEGFSRTGVAALAGSAVGIGMDSKEQFPIFIAGLLAVVLLRNHGWRNWRGIAAFAITAFVVGAPWYLVRFSDLGSIISGGLIPPDLPARANPPRASLANVGWYGWATLNALLFAPLFAFAVIGVGRAVIGVARRRGAPPRSDPITGLAPELLGGLTVAWLALSLAPHHDIRYAQPLIVYLAVLGTAWIVTTPRRIRAGLTAALLLAVVATTLGASFGVGHDVRVLLAHDPAPLNSIYGIPPLDQLTLYANHDFNVAGPRHAADLLALFRTMRRDGITGVAWNLEEADVGDHGLDTQGLLFFARIAHLPAPIPGATTYVTRPGTAPAHPRRATRPTWNVGDPHHAFLVRLPPERINSACLQLADSSGLSITLGNPRGGGSRSYCPAESAEP